MRIIGVVLLMFGCGETPAKDTDDREPDDGRACADDGDCGDGRICEQQLCTAGDRDNEMASASAFSWETPVDGAIEPAGDVDWYALESTGGEFVRVQTVVAEGGDLDTVVSLYDAAGDRISWEDAHPVGSVGTYDTVCYGYFPSAGTWYVKVEAREHFEGTGDGGLDYYTIEALKYAPLTETDAVYDAGYGYELAGANSWYGFPVLLEAAGDTDYASLELPFAAAPLYLVTMTHDESSTVVPEVLLYNGDADLVLRKTDPVAGDVAALLDSMGTRYVVGVTDTTGGGGADAWTWVFFMVGAAGDGNPRGDEPDDGIATANLVDMTDQAPDVGEWYAGYGESRVATFDDVDLWRFEVGFDDAWISVYVGAQSYGGLLVPRIEVLDATGAVLDTVDSAPGTDESALNLGPYPAGTYHLRVSSADDTAEGGEGYFYRFGVIATSVEVVP